jgi:hypothetical protein
MMLVDCQTCPVRDVHCADCMVTALTAIPLRPPGPRPTAAAGGHGEAKGSRAREVARPSGASGRGEVVTAPLDRAERRAVSAFLAAGLVTVGTANAARARLDPGESVESVVSVESVALPSSHRSRRAV